MRTSGTVLVPAAAVIIATLAVLGVALMTTRVDRRLRARDEETEAVRRSEARFRSLVVASAQVVWTASADGQFVEPQTSWAAYTGTSGEEYGSGGWTAAVHPDDRERVAAEWRQAVAERRVMEVELRLRRADGAWRHVAVRAVPVMEPGGRVREFREKPRRAPALRQTHLRCAAWRLRAGAGCQCS